MMRLTPAQARTVGRVLRDELRRLKEQSEAPAVAGAHAETVPAAKPGGGRCG